MKALWAEDAGLEARPMLRDGAAGHQDERVKRKAGGRRNDSTIRNNNRERTKDTQSVNQTILQAATVDMAGGPGGRGSW